MPGEKNLFPKHSWNFKSGRGELSLSSNAQVSSFIRSSFSCPIYWFLFVFCGIFPVDLEVFAFINCWSQLNTEQMQMILSFASVVFCKFLPIWEDTRRLALARSPGTSYTQPRVRQNDLLIISVILLWNGMWFIYALEKWMGWICCDSLFDCVRSVIRRNRSWWNISEYWCLRHVAIPGKKITSIYTLNAYLEVGHMINNIYFALETEME